MVKIKGSFLPGIISSYISKCCKITDEFVNGLAKDGGYKPARIALFRWSEVPGPSEYDLETVDIIAREFRVAFSGDIKIKKYPNDRTIKISDKDHHVIIRLDRKSNTATLTAHDGRTFVLAAEKSDDDLLISKIGEFRGDIALPVMHSMIVHNLLNLAFSIIIARKMGGREDDDLEARIGVDTEDFEILAQDSRATRLIEETHKLFTDRYKSFAELVEMNRRT